MFSSRRILTFLIALIAVALVSSTAYTQEREVDRPTGLDTGAHSLSFGFPTGGSAWGGILGSAPLGGSIGYFHNFDPQFQFGGGLAMSFDSDTDLMFELSPTAKFFLSTTERTVPYIFGNVDLGYDGNDFDFGLGFGLGAEFFPVPEFAIGARAGFLLIESTPADFATFTSGMYASFYF